MTECVLANILAAHFISPSDSSKAPSHIQAAKSWLVLPYNQLEDYIYGMLAFALLELGGMEDAAKKGLEINKQDFWSKHALFHVLQYDCRFKEAMQFMEERLSTWSSCSSFIHSKSIKKRQQLVQIGVQRAEAVYEYGRGRDKKALELLDSDFDASLCKMIGASEEQLDVFNEVWYNILMNTGQTAKPIEVLEKRIKKREGAPFLWCLLERAYSMAGREETVLVVEKARVLQVSYFK